ncbi:hypothetical protein D3C87_1321430 [compost metagenome]
MELLDAFFDFLMVGSVAGPGITNDDVFQHAGHFVIIELGSFVFDTKFFRSVPVAIVLVIQPHVQPECFFDNWN